MRTMRLINKTFALFIVLLFVVSFSLAGNSAAIPQNTSSTSESRSPLTNQHPIDQTILSDQGTNVNWHTDTGSYNDSWTSSNNDWLFGPEASYEIFFANSSQIDRLDFIPLNEEITWRISIPKSILRGAGIANAYTSASLYSQDMNFSAGLNFDFYNNTPATWSVYSYSWNSTSGYNGPPYMTINQPGCLFTEDSATYYITFKITFNLNTPVGLYGFYSSVYDTNSNSYNVKSYYSSNYDSDKIAIGIPRSLAFTNAYQGAYTLEKQDLSGDQIYSISRGTDFMMRFNITGNSDLDSAMLWNYYGGNMQIPVNRTGYHNAMVTKTGGWVYNSAIQTYIYNSSVEFTIPETVWGNYTDFEQYSGSDFRNYEYKYWMYNDTTSTYNVLTATGSDQMHFIYIYNFTTLSFETVYGFWYYTYPSDIYQPGLNQEMVFYSEPIENAPYQIFELNTTLSNTYAHDGVVSVEFIGHFTKDAPKGAIINFNDRVRGANGFDYGVSASDSSDALMTWQEYNDAKQIAVETPVTIAKLLKPDNSPVFGWFFPAKANEPFMVQGRLQGGADLASDIDGAIFTMSSYDSFYSDTTYGYTDMYYEILVGADHTVSLTSYNNTAMQNYTYGYHWEWSTYLTTGWHYEYNETTGNTVWIYGDYNTYGSQWVEGWYWDWFYFNQQTSEWVSSQDWHYYGIQSEATKVNSVFADVTNITTYTNGGDLYYSFLVNLTSDVREITHYWDFKFANNTWFEDPSSTSGFHDIAIWRPGWVQSFEYMGKEVYVDITSKVGVFNSSISGINDWLAVDVTPYITIEGVNYPIRVRNIMYPYSTSTEERLLFNDMNGNYYELLNGTKVYIAEERRASIYNVTIPGIGSFLSAQKQSLYWNDGSQYWNSWFDIYGNIHQGIDYNIWSNGAIVNYLNSSKVLFDGYYLRVGASDILKIQDYPRNDPRTGTEYVLDLNGTRYDLTYDSYNGNYLINYKGMLQHASYVYESYNATYLGSPVFVAGWNVLQNQWFTTTGHNEMPYPGALADWNGIYYTDANYGKVPTTKTVTIEGNTYFLGGSPDVSNWHEYEFNNHTGFWLIKDSTNYTLDGQKMWHASVNGTSFWQPAIVGGTLDYGHFNGLAFQSEGSIVTPNQNYVTYDHNDTYYYDYNWRVDFNNGTVFSCEPRTLFEVYLVNANGTIIYTDNNFPNSEWINETQSYRYYVLDLNSIRYYVDWGNMLPTLDVVIANGWEVWNVNGNATFHYIINGTEYIEDAISHYGITTMMFTNGTLDGKYFFRYSEHDNAVYQVVYKGTPYQVTSSHSYVYEIGSVQGKAYVYDLVPIESVTFKNFQEMVIGNPRWALWGVQTWTKSPINNALDLDGDLSTTNDQYYVLSEYQSTNNWTTTWSRMWVDLMWDPNGTLPGDEMHTNSWMGIETNTWSYQWQQSYYWYHANNLTPVSSAEWSVINSTLLNKDGTPRPGYWDIAQMARNVTWADIVSDAIKNGWDWFDQGEQTWTWLSFGVGQNYGVDSESGWESINLRYEYSGLMIWEDTNNNSIMETYMTHPGDGELTHYFIPDSVGSVSFVTPGLAYGISAESGSVLLGLEDEVTWGVTFRDVNGTTYPFNAYAYWDWYGGVVTGSDLRTFDERPTKVTIDEISFLVHFQGVLNTTEGATSNYATMKVDNTVGQWSVDLNGGTANLENKSLALNYFADVSTSQFRTTESGVATQEQTVVSNRFQIGDASSKFAEMIIGGVTYDWAYDPYTPYNVTSQTTPSRTFTSAFQSDNGQSATSWAFTSTQYYVSIGFPEWDGYYVYQDPVFVGYISNSGQSGGVSNVEFSSFSIHPTIPSSSDSVTIGVDIYTDVAVWSADLAYSTDGINFDTNSPMSRESPVGTHWTGTIPPFAEDTQIWYKVILQTEDGTYESSVQSYIVGKGAVIITPTMPTTTTTTGYTGPITGPPMELIMMVGGIGLVVVLLIVIAKRRK
jgi:hypothetical protein